MKTAIIIPAYNEEKTIAPIVRQCGKYGTVIAVNDASKDRTAVVARRAGATVITHPVNRGLGSALRTGFNEALRRNFDTIITIDADGQHDPDQIPIFLSKISEGYDFVLGRRDLLHYPFIKKFGNVFLNFATNMVSGTNLKDTESGFRAFRASALRKFYLKAERYEIAVEIVFEVGRNDLKYVNVDIDSPLYRKGVSLYDGIKNFRYLLHRRKRNLKDYIKDFRFVVKHTARSVLHGRSL